MWNYADLSKAAKAMGGPDKFMAYLVDSGRKSGRIEGAIFTAVGLSALGLASYGVKVVYDKFVNSDAKNAQIVDEYMKNCTLKADLGIEFENIDTVECAKEDCIDDTDTAYLSEELMQDSMTQTHEESEIQNKY